LGKLENGLDPFNGVAACNGGEASSRRRMVVGLKMRLNKDFSVGNVMEITATTSG